MMKRVLIVLFLFAQCALLGCAEGNKEDGKGKRKKKDDLVVIHTSFGDMTVLLYEETPLHKANFLRLARAGAYDSTVWHRVIKDFMVQGGDVEQKSDASAYELETIPAEIVDGFYHTKGSLAAARQADQVNPEKKSSSCQFYIVDGRTFKEEELLVDQYLLQRSVSQLLNDPKYDTIRQQFMTLSQQQDVEGMNNLAMSLIPLCEEQLDVKIRKDVEPTILEQYTQDGGAPHLDGAYTVFGRVVEGMEVIDQIAAVETNRMDRPEEEIYLTMDVQTLKTKDITKMYGYEYPLIEK
ncbi:MAG: peptidylprolyl isomerase [Bacteroidota bacterium]